MIDPEIMQMMQSTIVTLKGVTIQAMAARYRQGEEPNIDLVLDECQRVVTDAGKQTNEEFDKRGITESINVATYTIVFLEKYHRILADILHESLPDEMKSEV